MSLYPYAATIFTHSVVTGKATYTKGATFKCHYEMSPSKVKNSTGAVTTADAMVFTKQNVITNAIKKDDRIVIERGSQVDVLTVVKPEPIKTHHIEIYLKLSPGASVDLATGVMK